MFTFEEIMDGHLRADDVELNLFLDIAQFASCTQNGVNQVVLIGRASIIDHKYSFEHAARILIPHASLHRVIMHLEISTQCFIDTVR